MCHSIDPNHDVSHNIQSSFSKLSSKRTTNNFLIRSWCSVWREPEMLAPQQLVCPKWPQRHGLVAEAPCYGKGDLGMVGSPRAPSVTWVDPVTWLGCHFGDWVCTRRFHNDMADKLERWLSCWPCVWTRSLVHKSPTQKERLCYLRIHANENNTPSWEVAQEPASNRTLRCRRLISKVHIFKHAHVLDKMHYYEALGTILNQMGNGIKYYLT